MGILLSSLSIAGGTLIGSAFKEKVRFKNFAILGIAIMIISLVGFIENMFGVEGFALKSKDLLIVVFALITGTVLGDALRLESKLSNISDVENKNVSQIIDTTIFFGVGGMQICGPMLLATAGDNSQLILKSMIDFPFALMFGMSYGKRAALSALPVAAGQVLIVLLTIVSKNLLDEFVVRQVCAMGYIILFFSGFNLICEKQNKINNVNMIIGILVIILYAAVCRLWR
jgi:uncharacterized membrane protein YqgA involved in biofilm formation